jgi:hypothetical protein
MEAWRLKMEPGKVYRLVVADSHHFEERWIRIRIKVKSWIRSPALLKFYKRTFGMYVTKFTCFEEITH